MNKLPENWEKTTDKSGQLKQLKDNNTQMAVVLRYEKKGEMNITEEDVVVIMEKGRDGYEYYWRYDDQSGELEYEYQVFGDVNTSFDRAKSAARKKVEVVSR